MPKEMSSGSILLVNDIPDHMWAYEAAFRAHGYDVACGLMSLRVRNLLRQLGLELEVLGPDRTYWSEPRAPVRFALAVNALSLGRRWSPEPDASEGEGARRPG